MTDDPDIEILLEINRIGAAAEVRAVSAGDGLEVSFAAPANTPHADLERLARTKLAYVRGRQGGGGGPSSGPSSDGRGGIVV
ncbi:MAG: hypothetical protein GC155_09620 [Alphaproteobacteria bacterium]|nr:hypothetical protein [Alphaproteobacteria bacterium]